MCMNKQLYKEERYNMNIYRFMTFFELYNIIKNNKLKFSKLKLMDDNNEGLAQALTSQLPSSFNFGFSQSHQEIIDYHSQIRNHKYITCWSKEKDSIAMWLLYSQNKDFIRVKTNTDKLKKFADNFAKDNFLTKHLKSPEGTLQTDIPYAELKDVEYINFNTIVSDIKTLYKQQRESIELLYKEKIPDEDRQKKLTEILNRTKKNSSDLISNPLFLKDKAYHHENEIRATLSVFTRNSISYEEWKNNKNSDKLEYVFSTATTDYTDSSFNKNLPNTLHITIDKDFIEEICFDPRMPQYQQNIYKEILNTNIKIIHTNVFGTLSDDINLGMSYCNDELV